jgi:hypothetical protein
MQARTLVFAGALAVLAAGPAAAQQPDIRPGLWEFTMTGMGDMKHNVCLTTAMVKDMKQMAAKGDANSDCKAANEKVSGGSRTFDVTCTKPAMYQAHVVVTVEGPDRFTMAQDFTAEHGGKKQSGKMTIAYRRIGDCK